MIFSGLLGSVSGRRFRSGLCSRLRICFGRRLVHDRRGNQPHFEFASGRTAGFPETAPVDLASFGLLVASTHVYPFSTVYEFCCIGRLYPDCRSSRVSYGLSVQNARGLKSSISENSDKYRTGKTHRF